MYIICGADLEQESRSFFTDVRRGPAITSYGAQEICEESCMQKEGARGPTDIFKERA